MRTLDGQSTFFGRRVLLWLVALYRQHISGRGPLRRIACTFAQTESCSAYGQRVIGHVATSASQAVGLIRNRLRTCRTASLYRGKNGLLWGELYELPPIDLDASLRVAHETNATRATVLRGRAMVAKACHDQQAMLEAIGQARALYAAKSTLLLRRAEAIRKVLTAKVTRRSAVAAVAVAIATSIAFVGIPAWLWLTAAAFAATLTLQSAKSATRWFNLTRRLETIDASHRFEM